MEAQPTIENKLISTETISDKGKSTKEGNKGEKDEIKYKKELFEKRMDINYCTALFGSEAQEGIEIINIETGNQYENITDIKKSKSASKADTIIILIKTQKRLNISIKSKTGAKPSIINHTPRSANAFQNEYLHQFSFKTPTSWADLSETGGLLCASEMRKGVIAIGGSRESALRIRTRRKNH